MRLPDLPKCDHNAIEPTSQCCGGYNYYGFCSKCSDHTGWVKYCEVCDTEFTVEDVT